MISDIFVEQLVRRKQSASTKVLRALVWIAVAIVVLPFCITPQTIVIAPVVLVVAVIVARLLLRQLNLEFEYALTNNELDISVIIGQKRRREMVSLRANEVEFMAPVCAEFREHCENSAIITTYNATTSDNSPTRWFVIFRQSGKLLRLIFEPNDKMVVGVEKYNPHVVHRATIG